MQSYKLYICVYRAILTVRLVLTLRIGSHILIIQCS